MTYGVQLVADDELAGDKEWALLVEPDRLVLVIAASAFCARVVAEGMAAMGEALLHRVKSVAA